MPALRSLVLTLLHAQTEALAGRMPSLADRRSISEAECRTCLETGQIGAKYDQGLNTYRVPMALHALNRARLCDRMKQHRGVVLVQGGDQQLRYDTDHEPVFRQESYFQWLFGVSEPGCYGAVDLETGAATLFVPDLRSEAYEIFCGVAPSCDAFVKKYAVDACYFTGSLQGWLADAIATDDEAKVYLLHGRNSDSGNYAAPASFDGDDVFRERRDLTTLFDAIADLRTKKTAAEVEVMRYVNWVSSGVDINQWVGSIGDGAAALAPSSSEEPAPPRYRAGVASMAWRPFMIQRWRDAATI